MAHGAPDWTLGVNILMQQLDQLIQRPKYGICAPASFSGYVDANATTLLAEISGVGIIYQVFFYVQSAASQKNDCFIVEIDGIQIPTATFLQAIQFNSVQQGNAATHMDCFDEVNFRYSGSIGYGITFESSVKAYYKETHGNTPYVSGMVLYATI